MNDFLAELQALAERPPADTAIHSVDLLLSQLEPRLARRLRLCAIPHHFNPEILCALENVESAEAETRCLELTRFSIVMVVPPTLGMSEGWTLHDDARRHLFESWLQSASQQEFRHASERLVQHFSQAGVTEVVEDARRRHRMFHLLGVDRDLGFEDFESLCREERRQLRLSECNALINLVHEYDLVMEPEKQLALTYYEGKLAADLRDWASAELRFQEVLDNSLVPLELRVKANLRLGYVYQQQRRWDLSIKHYEEALTLSKSTMARGDDIQTLQALGAVHRDRGNVKLAAQYLNQAIKLARSADDRFGLANAYNSLGTLHLKRGEPWLAIKAFQQSLDCVDPAQDRIRASQLYNNLGNAYAEIPDWGKSEVFFQKSLELKRAAGDTRAQAMTLNNLSRVYQAQKRHRQAIDCALESIRLFEQVHDFYNAAATTRNLARLHLRMNNLADTKDALRRAIALFERCQALETSKTAREELESLDRRRRIPWWAWVAVGVFGLLVILFLLAIVVALALAG